MADSYVVAIVTGGCIGMCFIAKSQDEAVDIGVALLMDQPELANIPEKELREKLAYEYDHAIDANSSVSISTVLEFNKEGHYGT